VNPVLRQCPVCQSALAITRLECRACGTSVEGRFQGGPFAGLNSTQLEFVETFVRCEGKFTRMEGEIGMSYPTLRARLHEIIRAMGYEPGAEESRPSASDRKRILEKLEAGELDAAQAVTLLRGDAQPEASGVPTSDAVD
jgi:hypothetical protein